VSRWAAVLLLPLVAAVTCVSAGSRSGPAPGSLSRAPYDAPPASAATIPIRLDLRAAREILATLSRDRFDPAEAKSLEALPAIGAAIRDSQRPAEVFERDLAAAFEEQSRVAVFDFRKIREERSSWEEMLAAIGSREAELTRSAASRALALLPADLRVSVPVEIDLTFGLPGREDHLVLPDAEGGGRRVVVDLARALSDVHGSPAPEQLQHLSRLMAGEAYQPAWAVYRAGSAAWQKRDPALGPLEPLLRAGAEVGPSALYTVNENFFPMSVWLKEPMKASIDEFNRVAERLASAEGDLDQRVQLAAEVRRPEFASRVAGPAGAFFADGITQTLGIDAYRTTLSGGPRAFYEAYDRAAVQKKRELIPLAKVIRDRLSTAAPAR